jgi:hypothetical protein
MSDLARGYARMRQLGQQDLAKAEVVAKELIDGLARPATPVDRIQARVVAALVCKLERTLACGKDTSRARRALTEAIANSPFAPAQAREAAPQ